MQVSSNKSNVNFNAVSLAQWRCKTLNNKTKDVVIVAMEQNDLGFVENFIKKAKDICKNDPEKFGIVDDTILSVRDILKNINERFFERVKIFLALNEGVPCGFLVGNIPKLDKESEQIKYSSRHNSAKNETELDWLVTWQPKGKARIKGIGTALVCEYFRTIKKDKFRDVFVRSEVPEKSYAAAFYEKLGFEILGTKRLKLFNKNSAQYIISDYGDGSDDTIPMIITRKKLQDTAQELSTKMTRQEFKPNSMCAEDLIII